ncbi:hypothetical protein GCM10022243_31600 [Saccharothrix violaceirubra]
MPCPTVRSVIETGVGNDTRDDAAVRHKVMKAAAIAAHALTDTEQEPVARLRSLWDAHGAVLAARGVGVTLPFDEFRRMLSGDLAELLPDGVAPAEMAGWRLITADGEFDDDVWDLEQEQRAVLRALASTTRRGKSTSSEILQGELDQDTVYTALRKRQNQGAYERGRRALIDTPAGSDAEVRELNLPSTVTDHYRAIPTPSSFGQWWFACPLCKWPMRITVRGAGKAATGTARCHHRPHVEFGASYNFRIPDTGKPPVLVPAPPPTAPTGVERVLFPDVTGRVPEALPVAGHKALTRGVWRSTTIPGLVEVALYDALTARGLACKLWPDLDSYDLLVKVPVSNGTDTSYRIDVKDFTSALLLADKIRADEGDAGGAQWLVVPDYRRATVSMLSAVCGQFGLRVAHASDLGARICEEAGTSWL